MIPNDASLVITGSRKPHAKTPIPEKQSKSGLVGVWHKNNLYLGTNTTGNGKPSPKEYWFANEKYKDDATKRLTLTQHTHTKCGKQKVLLIWIV
jgi:hypothetical protein